MTGYASGHDHCLEYIDDNSGVVYVLSGLKTLMIDSHVVVMTEFKFSMFSIEFIPRYYLL